MSHTRGLVVKPKSGVCLSVCLSVCHGTKPRDAGLSVLETKTFFGGKEGGGGGTATAARVHLDMAQSGLTAQPKNPRPRPWHLHIKAATIWGTLNPKVWHLCVDSAA
jgi:hypothetical protein